MKKIIAVDIDGTLLDSSKNLSDRTRESLIKAQKKGHIVVIASGRDPKGVEKYAKALKLDEFNGLISNYNGCQVSNFKTKKVLVNHLLDYNILKDYIEFSKNLKADYIFYIDNKIHTTSKNSKIVEFTANMTHMDLVINDNLLDIIDYPLNNVILAQEDPNVLDDIESKIRDRFDKDLNIVRSTENYLEAMPKGYSKGTSLIEIANYYELLIDDIIAFGDERNDIEMIKDAGTGVAMANAVDIIKDLADYITLSNDDDGIAYYLEKFNII